jgi:hypothetical protein
MAKLFFFISIIALNCCSLSAQNVKCSQLSVEVQQFVASLKRQNYDISPIAGAKSLVIETYGKSNRMTFKNLKGFKAKRKTELRNGLYVRFTLYEICFENAGRSKMYEAKINSIINGNDLRNEKTYDFIVRNNERLIYITTDARIFYESVLEHKRKLEIKIKNRIQ